MNIPKNTKLTLKRIIESIQEGTLPDDGFGTKKKQLTPEEKQKLQSMASMFESYGQALQKEDAIMNSSKGLTELCELAEQFAIQECGDIFQKNIVDKDFKDLKKRVTEYSKISKEAYALIQQLRMAHQDMGYTLGKYFDLRDPNQMTSIDSVPMDQNGSMSMGGEKPLQEEELNNL